MERVLNPRDEKQTIYEIYRACRLCGAGAGYKMPIIQNVVDLDGDGVELRQKIKECVQIEVNHTDRMPPLICELCVDKVNDFYQFLDMCKQNNKRTRLRLGLPLQTGECDSVDSENCILGVTEPMFIESDTEPITRQKGKKTAMKKEPVDVKIKTYKGTTKTESGFSDSDGDTEPLANLKSMEIIIRKERVQTKIEKRPSPKPDRKPRPSESRESSEEPRWANMPRSKKRAPSPIPKRTTRQNAEAPLTPQNEDLLLIERKLKRPREKETKTDTSPPPKRVKIAPEPVKIMRPGPKSSKIAQKEPPKILQPALKKDLKPLPAAKPASKALPSKALPTKALPSKALPSKALPSKALPSKALPTKALPTKALPTKALPTKATLPPEVTKAFYCRICKIQSKTSQGYAQHNTKHIPTFTSPKHACNACELWFSTVEETVNHHKNHKNQNIPYKCTRCYGYFKLQQAYEDHFGSDLCLSVYEVPDVKCSECWRTFPTSKLMEEHKCAGEDGRPGGKCNKCRRSYALLKNLLKHESTCTHKKKGKVKVDPDIKARLLPMQVRIARCDPLIIAGDHVDTSKVSHRYGLDGKCQYPYLPHVQVKTEPLPFDHMVAINEDIKEEFSHWDSDSSDVSGTASGDTDISQKVDSLSTISLKTIFSKKCMGKVPRKKRTVKSEAFDSFNVDFELGAKIENIIDNLSNDDTHTSFDSDSILDKGDLNSIKNDSENDVKKNAGNALAIKVNSRTGSCDSESILDKNKSDVAEKVEDGKENDDTSEKQNEAEKQDHTSEKRDETPEKQDDVSEKIDDMSVKQNDTPETQANTSEIQDDAYEKIYDTSVKQDDTSEKRDDTSVNQDDTSEKQAHTSNKQDDTSEKRDDTSEKQDDTSLKRDDTSVKQNDTSEKQDDTSEKQDEAPAVCISTPDKLETANVLKDSEKEINCEIEKDRDYLKSFVDNTAAPSNESIDKVFDDNTENVNHDNDDEITKNYDTNDDRKELDTNETETDLSNEKDSKNGNLDSNNQFFDDIENLKSDNDVHNVTDVIVSNDSDKMDVDQNVTNDDTVKDTINSDRYEIQDTLSENNENFSKIDEITSKILENQASLEAKDTNDTNDIHRKEPHSDTISLNSVCDNDVENRDKYNVNDLSEDDRILMAELDAQIGENEQSLGEFGENDERLSNNDENLSKNDEKSESTEKKERLIDDLLRKQEIELRSLDLDRVSDDEYNFDV